MEKNEGVSGINANGMGCFWLPAENATNQKKISRAMDGREYFTMKKQLKSLDLRLIGLEKLIHHLQTITNGVSYYF